MGKQLQRQRSYSRSKRYRTVLKGWRRGFAPLVVVGMTRTGTTMLQRVLASDPRHYAAIWWEVRNPTPWPGTRWDAPDPRIADAEEEVRQVLACLLYTSPSPRDRG